VKRAPLFITSDGLSELSRHVGQFSKAGLELAARGNTMTSQKICLQDLPTGFISADRCGVLRVAEPQSHGYLYPRP